MATSAISPTRGKAMFSRTVRIVVVTLPLTLGLGLAACKRAPKTDSLRPGNTISAAKSPQSVTCPKGARAFFHWLALSPEGRNNAPGWTF
jgi:hypothetical protein